MAESIPLKIESPLNPITALAFLGIDASQPYLLAGEGKSLKVFDVQRSTLVHTKRIFCSQAIHGIACRSRPQGAGHDGIVLIWGGRSICLLSIETCSNVGRSSSIRIQESLSEIFWDDWILDGCFRPANIADGGPAINAIEAFFVTAHNKVLLLSSSTGLAEMEKEFELRCVASGPNSILYSAHMLWADAGQRLLGAAGTVFGEVLFWSSACHRGISPDVHLLYVFTGHEGSVFGVRISEVAQSGAVKRILASCSDDRTIRVWDISNTSRSDDQRLHNQKLIKSDADSSEGTNEAEATRCLATIMGHASRIWGLRFLTEEDGCWNFVSYGEDSTAQLWSVGPVLGQEGPFPTPLDHIYVLSHKCTYAFHSGKNLWALTVFPEADGDCMIATGGADGRLTIYKPQLHRVPARSAACTSHYTMDEVSKTFPATLNGYSTTKTGKVESSTRNVFDSLKGSWRLSRNLDSLVPSYPSGKLEGTATFTERTPTDNLHDVEYLYSESGDFATQHGLTMKATRQYVYRYSQSNDKISVWFVKPDASGAVDYLFHELDFQERHTNSHSGHEVRPAKGYHLCIEDNYNADYSFHLINCEMTQWHAVFDVDGPKKNYTARSTYTRDRAESLESEKPNHVIQASVTKTGIAPSNQDGQENLDAFKTYTWISENDFLATTEHGNIWVGTTETSNLDRPQNIRWRHVSKETNLSSSNIATAIPSLGIALLAGIDGTVILYNHRSKNVHVFGKLTGKAGFLKSQALSEQWSRWLRSSHQREMVVLFATCLGSCQATVFMFPPEIIVEGRSVEKEASIEQFRLTLPSKFVVTSSCFLGTETWIILGSRSGDIAIYDLAHIIPNFALDVTPGYFSNTHGEDTITLVQVIPHDISKLTDRTAILTAGRNGEWALHHVFQKPYKSGLLMTLETIHVGVPPFGPNIEGAYIDPTTKNLVLWGFRSKRLVVWNETQKTQVTAVDCGGAHRNWAYSHRRDGDDGGTFVYTKASVCHVQSQTQASHRVLQHGGHGREIKAMALSPSLTSNDGSSLRLIATGAEDTTIRISRLDATLKCLSIITKHTTGIQQLRWSPNGHLLFSAAGCEEFFVWRLRPAPLVDIGVICAARCPTMTDEADLRIMDFAIEEIPSDHDFDDDDAYEPDYLITMIYSDSSLRIFHYHTSAVTNQKFHLLKQASYTTYCLTQATYLSLPTNNPNLKTVCTASTDGRLAFWSLPLSSSSSPPPHQPLPPLVEGPAGNIVGPIHHTTSPPFHASSIKTLSHTPLTPSSTLLLTGGDDGAIALTRLTRSPASASERGFTTATLVLPRAHAGAVTGVVVMGDENGDGDGDTFDHRGARSGHEGQEVRTYNIATLGNDQRLKTWRVCIDVERDGIEGVRVWKGENVCTGVADAGALRAYRDEEGGWVLVVVGIGVERWRVGGKGVVV